MVVLITKSSKEQSGYEEAQDTVRRPIQSAGPSLASGTATCGKNKIKKGRLGFKGALKILTSQKRSSGKAPQLRLGLAKQTRQPSAIIFRKGFPLQQSSAVHDYPPFAFDQEGARPVAG
jgi:hypothetical protein